MVILTGKKVNINLLSAKVFNKKLLLYTKPYI
jgi:hypothetical protein